MKLRNLKDFDINIKKGLDIQAKNENIFVPKNKGGYALFVSNKNLDNTGFITYDGDFLTETKYESSNKKCLIEFGDIVITKVGELGKVALHDNKEFKNPIFASQNMGIIKNVDLTLNNLYLFQYFNSKFFKNQILRIGRKSIQNSLSQEDILSSKIPYFPIEEQEKIGNFLYNIDLLMRKNVEVIKKIEEYLANLYTYWFLQFDFPDENGNPYKSSGGEMVYNEVLGYEIPVGWQNGTLGDIVKFKRGTNFMPEELVDNGVQEVLKTRHITENNTVKFDKSDYTNLPKSKFKDYQFTKLFDLLFVVSGSIGKYSLCHTENQLLTYHITNLQFEETYRSYLFSLLASNRLSDFCLKSKKGSNIPAVNLDYVESYKIAKASNNIYINYTEKMSKYLSLIISLRKQNDKLECMKNYYSELLFTGQIKIKFKEV